MWQVRDFEGKLMEGWERGKNDNGISYYIYHEGEHTQWDHPLMTSINQEIFSCNSIKYVAYRTASKCRILQKVTHLHKVKLPTIVSQFDQHGFHLNEDKIRWEQLENLLLDVYAVTMRDQTSSIAIKTLAEVTANIYMHIYDRARTGAIRVSSARIALTLFCSARLQEKYKYLFRQFSDHNNCISRLKLVDLLKDISYIPEYLSEKPSFGSQLVELAASTCYKAEAYTLGVTEDAFMEWLLREPQTLVWISTLYRITLAETSVHELKCNVCKTYPMTGLRYRCLRCFQFDLCQKCFFTGQSNKRHKLYHPLQEYCYRSTSKEGTKAFMTTIKNMFSKKSAGNMKQRYLPINQTAPNNISSDIITGSAHSGQPFEDECSSKCASEYTIEHYQVPLDTRTIYFESLDCDAANSHKPKQVKDLIMYLQDENRQLKAEVENFRNATSNFTGSTELRQGPSQQSLDSNLSLELKLNRLRSLLNNLKTVYLGNETMQSEQEALPPRYESTPTRNFINRQVFNMDSPMDARYNCAISNISSPQNTPQRLNDDPRQWDRRLGDLPLFARRSLPLNSFQRAYPVDSVYHQPSTSTQRASARAVLETRGFSTVDRGAAELLPTLSSTYTKLESSSTSTIQHPYHIDDYIAQNGSHGGPAVDALGDSTSTGLGRIQTELESIIRQLEAVYPGSCSQHTMAVGNVSDKFRIMATANEIENMLRDLVAKMTLTGSAINFTNFTPNSTENIPQV